MKRKSFFIFSGLFLTFSAIFILFYFKNKDFLIVEIENKARVKAEIAETQKERILGLSYRKKLEKNHGMIFIFEKEDYHPFWMKNMNFSIDIIWIDGEKKIIDITENVSPETFPKVFRPSKPAKFVLEVEAGFVKENNIKIGDKIQFRKDGF